MPQGEIHVNDTGTVFRATIRNEKGEIVNLSEATVLKMEFRKPNNLKVVKNANLSTDGSDGKIEYITQPDDLDKAGQWTVQGYVEVAGGSWHSDKYTFQVLSNL